MNRILVVLIFLTAACASNPAPVPGQQTGVDDADRPAIHVTATATEKRAPDVAVIELAVETVEESAAAAGAENAARMESVLAAIREQGVDASRIRTRRLELQPQYDQRRDRETREIVAYRAVNQVTVRLDDVEATGGVVDAAVRAGANRVSGIRFELSDAEAAYHDALRQAIAKARAEAETAASALGLRLGDPIRVSTGGFRPPSTGTVFERTLTLQAERIEAVPPPVQPGEVEVEASVSITWRLES